MTNWQWPQKIDYRFNKLHKKNEKSKQIYPILLLLRLVQREIDMVHLSHFQLEIVNQKDNLLLDAENNFACLSSNSCKANSNIEMFKMRKVYWFKEFMIKLTRQPKGERKQDARHHWYQATHCNLAMSIDLNSPWIW